MRYQTYLKVVGCCFIITYFLWSVNNEAHSNYNIISKEINRIKDTPLNQKEFYHEVLVLKAKKRKDYKTLVNQLDSLIEKVESSKTMLKPATKTSRNSEVEKYESILGKHFTNSIQSQDSLLRKLYLEMAFIDHIEFLNHSLTAKKNFIFDTKIITMNEPVNYKVGKSYHLYFKDIKTIDPNQFKSFHIIQNGKQIQLSDFPLTYEEAPGRQQFKISYETNLGEFHSSRHSTIRHDSKPILNP